ncbi:MAG: F0F1 ATP synthase subunit B [Planctomycetota bacterium]
MSQIKSIAFMFALLGCMSFACVAQDESSSGDEPSGGDESSSAEVAQDPEVQTSEGNESESSAAGAEVTTEESVTEDSDADSDEKHADESHDGEDHSGDSHDEEGESHGAGHDSESGGSAHDHEGDGHGHTDLDPTHANMTDGTWEVVDFRTDMALFSAVVFLLLLAGLYGAAWKPIMEGLQKREESIAGNIAKAEQAAQNAEAKLGEYEAKLATANEEAASIVAEARKDAEATGQKLVAAAQEEAARLKERATDDVETAKRVALGELADQSTEVAMAVAQRVVGREVKADDHQSLIQEMLAKLPSKN